MALVAALLLMLVMTGLVLALTTSGRIEVAIGDNEALYEGTRAAAESGLNHAAVVLMQAANTPNVGINSLLAGADNAIDPANPSAMVNGDNGRIAHLMGGGPPWPVAPGSDYSYDVRVFDDDDPVLKPGAFTAQELAAMGPPPNPPEDGNRYNDVNGRLVIRATGFGPRQTRAVVEQMLVPVQLPALLIGGDLTMGNNAEVVGSRGSVHVNGNLTILNTAVTIAQNATATGTITSPDNWGPGGVESGGVPGVPLPDIHAHDYFSDADFVLEPDGRITNQPGTTVYCNAAANGTACRDVTPAGGTAPFGWTYDAASGWALSQNTANSATYYVKTNVRITGNPGSNQSPILLTIIAEGSIDITGHPDLQPEPASDVQFVTDKDLRVAANIDIPLAFEGRILVREQIDLSGNPTLAGQVIVQNAPSLSDLVDTNSVTGSVSLSYNGLIETVVYTVTGWREP